MKTLILLLSVLSAAAQVATNEAKIIHVPVSQIVTNTIEVHEADGSVHTDERIIHMKAHQGQVVAVIDGIEYTWPVRFKFNIATNHVKGVSSKPIAPVLPDQAADVQRGQSEDRRAESERNKPKPVEKEPPLPKISTANSIPPQEILTK